VSFVTYQHGPGQRRHDEGFGRNRIFDLFGNRAHSRSSSGHFHQMYHVSLCLSPSEQHK